MEFANRTEWPSAVNPLTRLRRSKEARGVRILDLTQSNPTLCGFSFYKSLDWLKPLTEPKNLSYEPDPRGLLSAREAVCAYYKEKGAAVRPEQVFLTAGTSEAYGHIFRLMTNPGDRVLVPRPSYPLFDFLAQIHDIELKPLGSGKARLAILVNPNNPTGLYVRPAEYKCDAILSDEVFFDFAFDEKMKGESFAGKKERLTFTLSGISKILALPQMKLAWIVVSGPDKEREEAMRRLEIIADTALSVSTPAQNAFPVWMAHRKAVLDEMRSRILANRRFLVESFLRSEKIKILESEAGWYSILKIDRDEDVAAMELLEKHDVFSHPGYFFDFEAGAHLVLSHILPEDEFRQAVGRMVKYFHG